MTKHSLLCVPFKSVFDFSALLAYAKEQDIEVKHDTTNGYVMISGPTEVIHFFINRTERRRTTLPVALERRQREGMAS